MDSYSITKQTVYECAAKSGYEVFEKPGVDFFIVCDDTIFGIIKQFEMNPNGYDEALRWMIERGADV